MANKYKSDIMRLCASYLYVSVNKVGQWERGERKPSGPLLKLLSLAKMKGLEAIR